MKVLQKGILLFLGLVGMVVAFAKTGIIKINSTLSNVNFEQLSVNISDKLTHPFSWAIIAAVCLILGYCLVNLAKKLFKVAGIIAICLIFIAGVTFANAYQVSNDIKSIESYTVESENTILYSSFEYNSIEENAVYNKLDNYKLALKDKQIEQVGKDTVVQNIGPKICIGKDYFGYVFVQYVMCHVKTADGKEGYIFENQLKKKNYTVEEDKKDQNTVAFVKPKTTDIKYEKNIKLIYLLSAQEKDN